MLSSDYLNSINMNLAVNVLLAGEISIERACYLSPNYREGTGWLVDILERMKIGKADFAEIDMLEVKVI